MNPRTKNKNYFLAAFLCASLGATSIHAQSVQEQIASAEVRDLAIKKHTARLFTPDAVVFVSGNEISISCSSSFRHHLQAAVETFALAVLWNANYTRTYGGRNWNFEYVHVSARSYSSFSGDHDQGEAIVRLSDYSSKDALDAVSIRRSKS